MLRTAENAGAPGSRLAWKNPHSSWGSLSLQAFVAIATWTRPPLPAARSQAEYSRPDGRTSPVTTGIAAENVAPQSVDLAYFGPSGESPRRWIVPAESARATTGRPTVGTETVVTRLDASSPRAMRGQREIAARRARAGPACGIV